MNRPVLYIISKNADITDNKYYLMIDEKYTKGRL